MDFHHQPGEDDDAFRAWLREQTPARLASDIVAWTTPAMVSILTMTGHTPPERGGQSFTETVIVSAYIQTRMVVLTYPQNEIYEPDPITLGGVVRVIHITEGLTIGGVFSAELGRLMRGGWRPISDSEHTS